MPTRAGVAPAVRNDPPVAADWGVVTRPLFTLPVVVVAEQPAATSTLSSVPSALVSTTLLVANANRLFATFQNDSNSRLFLALAPVASLTSYTVRIGAQGYWELPYRYTGIITGIWSPVASRAVRITELEP